MPSNRYRNTRDGRTTPKPQTRSRNRGQCMFPSDPCAGVLENSYSDGYWDETGFCCCALDYAMDGQWYSCEMGLICEGLPGEFGEPGFGMCTDNWWECCNTYGCMDPDASNYDAGSTIDDGNCSYDCQYYIDRYEATDWDDSTSVYAFINDPTLCDGNLETCIGRLGDIMICYMRTFNINDWIIQYAIDTGNDIQIGGDTCYKLYDEGGVVIGVHHFDITGINSTMIGYEDIYSTLQFEYKMDNLRVHLRAEYSVFDITLYDIWAGNTDNTDFLMAIILEPLIDDTGLPYDYNFSIPSTYNTYLELGQIDFGYEQFYVNSGILEEACNCCTLCIGCWITCFFASYAEVAEIIVNALLNYQIQDTLYNLYRDWIGEDGRSNNRGNMMLNDIISEPLTRIIAYFVGNGDCPAIGDLNGDGAHNVLDIVALANCILANNCSELENGCAGDMNCDGGYNVLDIVALANCVLDNNCWELEPCTQRRSDYNYNPPPGMTRAEQDKILRDILNAGEDLQSIKSRLDGLDGRTRSVKKQTGSRYVYATTGQPYNGQVVEAGGSFYTTTTGTIEGNSVEVVTLSEYNNNKAK